MLPTRQHFFALSDHRLKHSQNDRQKNSPLPGNKGDAHFFNLPTQ